MELPGHLIVVKTTSNTKGKLTEAKRSSHRAIGTTFTTVVYAYRSIEGRFLIARKHRMTLRAFPATPRTTSFFVWAAVCYFSLDVEAIYANHVYILTYSYTKR